MRRRSEWVESLATLYQLAGDLTLGHLITDEDPDTSRTKGQLNRMRELLLDVLSDPDRWTAETIRASHKLALEE